MLEPFEKDDINLAVHYLSEQAESIVGRQFPSIKAYISSVLILEGLLVKSALLLGGYC